MTNNDLLTISELLDIKLEPIKEAQTKLQETQDEMQVELREVKSELKSDINELRTELKGDINELRTELKGDINELRTELKGDINDMRSELKGDINDVRDAQTRTELILENDVIPRLQNIEACYTDAYDKYAGSVAEVRVLKTELDIVKNVVKEHSEKLNAL